MKKELELEALDFEVGAFVNYYRWAIFYFDNDKNRIIKKQVFINGAEETKFLLKTLGIDRYDNDMLFNHYFITLVLEKGGENRIVAIADPEYEEYEVIRNTYSEYGKYFTPDGNISYFKNKYKVSEDELYNLVDQAVKRRKHKAKTKTK